MSVNETTYLTGSRSNISNQILNKISTISKTGANISSVPVSIGVPLIRCVETGNNFKQNRVYVLKADNSGYTGVFPTHTHDPNDPFNEGGSLFDVYVKNNASLLDFNDLSARISNFLLHKVGTANGVTEWLNASIYILLITGTVAADVANIFKGGVRIAFSNPIVHVHKVAISHNTALLYRAGVNLNPVESTAGVQSQVGIEGCTSSSVNFQVVSGSGTARTSVALPNSNLLQSNPIGYKIEYYPGDKIIFTDGNGNTIIKSDNLPWLASASNGDSTLRYGIATSTTTAKAVKLFASRLIGKIYDSNSGIKAWL